MSTKTKTLNVLLAITDHLAKSWNQMVADYASFFKNKQGAFQGISKTYDPRPDTVMEDKMSGKERVSTTVSEKLQYFEETASTYLNALFNQEATNASGKAHTPLMLDGKVIANMSTLELLKLKGFLENNTLVTMYSTIPVRSDSMIWELTKNEDYKGREVWESPLQKGINKTTTKEHYILQDPNIDPKNVPSSYKAPVAVKDTVVELGDYTKQSFSGEWSHRERAELLRRMTNLKTAVIEALKVANEAPVVESEFTSQMLFDYLHRGKLKD